MDNGIKCESVKRGSDYFGRVAVYENGKRLYSFTTPVRRLSRGDAIKDAHMEAHNMQMIAAEKAFAA